jgi:hypothetical protein
MGRRPIGDRPLTNAERQRRRIAKLKLAASDGPSSDTANPALAGALSKIDRLLRENDELRRRLMAAAATAGGQPFNVEHLRRWPAMTAPWLYEKLGDSATDTLISEIKQARAVARRKAYQDQ